MRYGKISKKIWTPKDYFHFALGLWLLRNIKMLVQTKYEGRTVAKNEMVSQLTNVMKMQNVVLLHSMLR